MKPNVILINCDDLGYGDLGCYGSTINDSKTVDALAKEGVKFNSFYASSSICTPSRASLMTGCYAQRVSMPQVIFPAAKVGLDNNEFTMPKLFKNAGYNTMIIGKWHLGDNVETLPCKFGFDDYYGLPYSNDMGRQAYKGSPFKPDGTPKNQRPPLPLIHGEEVIQQQPDQTGITERYTEKSVEFIRKNAKNAKPFFLYLAHMHVHLPLYEQEHFLKKSKNGDFGACVASIDWSLELILHELKTLGIYEDTMIIFTSDNGSTGNHGASNAPLKGTKFSSWEGGFRVPFIVHWKGHVKEGVEINNMASNMDLLPAFADLIGEDIQGEKIDGVNILPMMMGDDKEIREEFAYYSLYNLVAIRKHNYKLHIASKETNVSRTLLETPELYDMNCDIEENNDIYSDKTEVANDMMNLLDKYREELGDTLSDKIGSEVRACRTIENPTPMAEYDPNHPYIISMYDKNERG